MRSLERKETEYMRLQRRKVGIDDFEQLTAIGKGAFGEVLCSLYALFWIWNSLALPVLYILSCLSEMICSFVV